MNACTARREADTFARPLSATALYMFIYYDYLAFAFAPISVTIHIFICVQYIRTNAWSRCFWRSVYANEPNEKNDSFIQIMWNPILFTFCYSYSLTFLTRLLFFYSVICFLCCLFVFPISFVVEVTPGSRNDNANKIRFSHCLRCLQIFVIIQLISLC